MLQTIPSYEMPLTEARVKGIPLYCLKGVTSRNLPVIRSTEMWVFYGHLGWDGWYLAVPDAWREAAEAGLARYDLSLEGVAELPTPNNTMYYLVGFCVFTGLVFISAVLALLLMLAVFAAGKASASDFAQYGEFVKPDAPETRKAREVIWNADADDTSSLCYVNTPGTTAWLMNSSLRNV